MSEESANTEKTRTPASPRPAAVLMLLTYAVGVPGMFFGFISINFDPPTLSIAAVLAVGVTGILSFIRHALYNRSDAAHGGWDYGERNNFQVEVGLANLAWGSYAILAVVLGWGLMAISAAFLIAGFYFVGVTVFVLIISDLRNRKIGPLIAIGAWGIVHIWLGILGVLAS